MSWIALRRVGSMDLSVREFSCILGTVEFSYLVCPERTMGLRPLDHCPVEGLFLAYRPSSTRTASASKKKASPEASPVCSCRLLIPDIPWSDLTRRNDRESGRVDKIVPRGNISMAYQTGAPVGVSCQTRASDWSRQACPGLSCFSASSLTYITPLRTVKRSLRVCGES